MFNIFSKLCFTEFLVLFMLNNFMLKVCNGFITLEKPTKRESSKPMQSTGSSIAVAEKQNCSLSHYYRHEPYGPQSYAFGYEINDKATDNRQFRDEHRFTNGTVYGAYGFLRADGRISVTNYTADSKFGFLSQTHNYVLKNDSKEHNIAIDWYAQFQPTEKQPESFMAHSAKNDQDLNKTITNALKMNYNIDINHIDLTKDLLSPTLWNIVNGQVQMKKLNESTKDQQQQQAKKLGFETFEKVIPNDFPLVPFKLPEETSRGMIINSTEVPENETTTEMTTPKLLDSVEEIESTDDWITKIVNDTRKEFLENIPNIL